MALHEFAITVSGIDPFNEEGKIDALYESGFDDATISCCAGRIIFDFSKEAPSVYEAVAEAIALLESVGASVVQIEHQIGPDFLLDFGSVLAQLKQGNRLTEETFRRRVHSDRTADIETRKIEAAARELDPEAFEDIAFGYSPSIAMQRRRSDATEKARAVLKAYADDDVNG